MVSYWCTEIRHSRECCSLRACPLQISASVESRVCDGTNPRSRFAASPLRELGQALASSAAAPTTPPSGGVARLSVFGSKRARNLSISSVAVNENPAIAYLNGNQSQPSQGVSVSTTNRRGKCVRGAQCARPSCGDRSALVSKARGSRRSGCPPSSGLLQTAFGGVHE
jgi:hypothetical protein